MKEGGGDRDRVSEWEKGGNRTLYTTTTGEIDMSFHFIVTWKEKDYW